MAIGSPYNCKDSLPTVEVELQLGISLPQGLRLSVDVICCSGLLEYEFPLGLSVLDSVLSLGLSPGVGLSMVFHWGETSVAIDGGSSWQISVN
ncbi:MAG: hypothetical protein VKK42_10485 [Lyngbya sp.]|nr:hypothetical protein [Lyngbya sp.]